MWRNYWQNVYFRYTAIAIGVVIVLTSVCELAFMMATHHLKVDMENEYGRRVVVTFARCIAADDWIKCRGNGYNEYADANWDIRYSTSAYDGYQIEKGDVLYYICNRKNGRCRKIPNFQVQEALALNPGFEFK